MPLFFCVFFSVIFFPKFFLFCILSMDGKPQSWEDCCKRSDHEQFKFPVGYDGCKSVQGVENEQCIVKFEI